MENVVKFPDELGRLFEDAHRAVAMGAESKQKFVEGKLLLSASLKAIRARFSDNEAFGKSCAEHGLGENVINKNDRAYLIQWAERPEWTRTVLEKTERTSVRTIHEKEWLENSLHHVMKSQENQNQTTVKRREAEEWIRDYKLTSGSYPTVIEACEGTGFSRIVIEPALAAVKAEDRTAPSTMTFTKAQEHHVEMRVKIEVKAAVEQLNASFDTEVQKRVKAEIDKLFPGLEKLREDAKRDIKIYRDLIAKNALFTEMEVMDIIKACHPDNSATKEARSRAFVAVNAKKFILMGKMQ